jgi:hypothetical protein
MKEFKEHLQIRVKEMTSLIDSDIAKGVAWAEHLTSYERAIEIVNEYEQLSADKKALAAALDKDNIKIKANGGK